MMIDISNFNILGMTVEEIERLVQPSTELEEVLIKKLVMIDAALDSLVADVYGLEKLQFTEETQAKLCTDAAKQVAEVNAAITKLLKNPLV